MDKTTEEKMMESVKNSETCIVITIDKYSENTELLQMQTATKNIAPEAVPEILRRVLDVVESTIASENMKLESTIN